jgi:hypothetical protein
MEPKEPNLNGYFFEDLTGMMHRTHSEKIITILDCCHTRGLDVHEYAKDIESDREEE